MSKVQQTVSVSEKLDPASVVLPTSKKITAQLHVGDDKGVCMIDVLNFISYKVSTA